MLYANLDYRAASKTFEREYVTAMLKKYGCILRTARAMGVTRRALYQLIKRNNIPFVNGGFVA